MKPKIKAILMAFNSKADSSGNRYWAFRFIDTITGKMADGKISGGESNIHSILYEMRDKNRFDLGEGGYDYFYTHKELPIRQWKQETEEMEYAGCCPSDLVTFILNKFETN